MALLLAPALAGGCSASVPPGGQSASTLKEAFKGAFLVGAAVNQWQMEGRDSLGAALVRQHFNSITPENILKWERVHPEPGVYRFEPADQLVEFGERNGMFVVGHTLVWHSQTPTWVFRDADGEELDRQALLDRMRNHIYTVVGRYKGRIHGWDVVNEALEEDGSLRQSPWLRIIGEDYIARAFQYAHEADPSAELYYNDYSLERAAKRAGAVKLVRDLQARGIRVAGVGLQGHHKMDWPSVGELDSTVVAFRDLGVKVMITELDVDILPRATRSNAADVGLNVRPAASLNPYPDSLPDAEQQALARRYRDIFDVYFRHRDAISRVTFWGVRDRDSWLNNWPVRGRTSYPLLFDREGRPKPAFDAVMDVARRRVER